MSRTVIVMGPLPPPPTGQSIANATACRILTESGFTVETIDTSRKSGTPIGKIGMRRYAEYGSALLRLAGCLRRSPATFYFHPSSSKHGLLRDFLSILMARVSGVRIVGHFHTGNFNEFYEDCSLLKKAMIKWNLRQIAVPIILSEGLRHTISMEPRAFRRAVVVPNCAPAEPDTAQKKDRPKPERVANLLFLSNICLSKGIMEAIDAVAHLRDHFGIVASLRVCGTFMSEPSPRYSLRTATEIEEAFHERVHSLGLQDDVEYCGVVTGADKARMLDWAHFLVLPTTYPYEAQPICVLEALAHGVIPVATSHRGIPELIADGESGSLISNPTGREIAQAIDAWDSPSRFAAGSRAARTSYQHTFSRSHHGERIVALMQPKA